MTREQAEFPVELALYLTWAFTFFLGMLGVLGCDDSSEYAEEYRRDVASCICYEVPEHPKVTMTFVDHEGVTREFEDTWFHSTSKCYNKGTPSHIYQVVVRDGDEKDYYYSEVIPKMDTPKESTRHQAAEASHPFIVVDDLFGNKEYILDHDSVRVSQVKTKRVLDSDAEALARDWQVWYKVHDKCPASNHEY